MGTLDKTILRTALGSAITFAAWIPLHISALLIIGAIGMTIAVALMLLSAAGVTGTRQ